MSEPTIAQRVNHIKKAWHEGRPAYGIITKAPGQSLVRTLAGLRRYGLDFIVMDAEHGNYDDASVHDSIHAIASLGVSPVCDSTLTADLCYRPVPWNGKRSVGNQSRPRRGCSRDHDPSIELEGTSQGRGPSGKVPSPRRPYFGGSFHTQAFHLEGHGRTLTQEEYWANANDATLIIAIIETKEGLENIDEIVQVKGLDAIFIGQYDLALSLGSLPQSDKRVIDGVQKIFDSAKKAGVPVIAWSPGDEAKAAVEQGCEGIMVGLDMSVLTKAFAGELAAAGAPKRW
ncbi:hypothetical protein EHS25_000580 [Saitozyma podzolica]|uniref:HpcH/HpaI aldolase/citrate lyase domain-containing protein n=1 Tax=Saitozyma podzolica TaxID=1890683 RepID=A0A427YWH7_9TREE|nr:hypothetical protein EHS25_000580 [Saitozyma podzolica]